MRGQAAFIAQDGVHAAWIRDHTLEVGPWGGEAAVCLEGQIARDILRDLETGALTPESRSRLEAIERFADPAARPVLQQLRSGAFLPATPASLVRRDGYEMLWIELLSRCNLRCVHCYAASDPDRAERLETATAAALIDDAASLGFRTVQFTGGEPTLHEGLVALVAHARQRGLEVELFTNAQLLTPPLIRELVGHDVRFAVSLYGHRAEVHEAVTRIHGSFDRTVHGIRWLREAGARMRVAVVLMEQNRESAAQTLDFAQELSGGAARAGAIRQMGRGTFDHDNLVAAQSLAHHPRVPDRAYTTGKACVTPDGSVIPCIFTRWLVLGQIGRDGGLADILASPRLTRQFAGPEGVERSLACRDCQQAASLLEGLVR